MDANSERLEEKLDRLIARVDRIESCTRRTDNEIESIQRRLVVNERRTSPGNSYNVPWRRIGGNPSPTNNVEHADTPQVDVNPNEEYQLPMDIYTVISVWKMKSSAFWISLLVIGVQFLLLALLLVDQVGSTGSSSIVVFPTNVPVIVHISQALATIIAILGQDDLRSAIEIYFDGLPTRFCGDDTFQHMGTRQWNFSCAIRFLQGLLSVVAAFILAIQSETVFDVLLNFLGVRFVSDLDDLAFDLSKLGYFGEAFQQAAKRIAEVKFQQDNRNKVDDNRSWFRKYAHVIGVFAVLVAVLALYLFIVINQNKGDFSVQEVTLEIRDGSLPFAVVFNGCYLARQSGEKIQRRLVYEQAGFEREGGKFAYCDNIDGSGEKAWTFSEGENFDPCENFIARTEATSTFNLLEAGENQWYTRDGVALASTQVSRVLNSAECGGFDENFQEEGCEQFDIEDYIDIVQNANRSASFSKMSFDVKKSTLFTYHALKHPIYVGDKSVTSEMYDLLFFTGQNWILTHPISSEIATALPIEEYIQNDAEFLSTLELIIKEGKFVDLVSETGRSKGPNETPLGKRWFHAIEVEDDAAFHYPVPDQTREKEIKLSCATCSHDNPCLFDGICRENNTCDCINGGTGKLCQHPPLGDGDCNTYFNKALYGYDGGDCCGGTCTGPKCGLDDFVSLFGLDSDKATVEDYGASNLGYGHCEDPSMAPLTIEMHQFALFNESTWISVFSDFGMPFCSSATINVRCGGITYLHVPSHVLQNTTDCFRSYEQVIQVPFGSSCEVSTNMGCFGPFCLNHTVSVYYGNSSMSTPIASGNVQSRPQLSFGVPSKCLTDVLSNQSSSIFDLSTPQGMAANTLANDGLSEFLCIKNRNTILERYALAVFNATVQLKSTNWQAFQCHGWGIPAVKTSCINDTIISFAVGEDSYSKQGTIPTEILLLSNLNHLVLTSGAFYGTIPRLPTSITSLELWGNTLTGTIPSHLASLSGLSVMALATNLLTGTIPTELAQLSLIGLWLDTNQLSGTIPSELGGMTQLETLTLVSNNLVGEIPTELTNLSNLKMCAIDDSFTGGPELPLCVRFDENGGFVSGGSN